MTLWYPVRMKKVSFYVGAEQWAALRDIAKAEGRQTSELVRQAISEFLRDYRPVRLDEGTNRKKTES